MILNLTKHEAKFVSDAINNHIQHSMKWAEKYLKRYEPGQAYLECYIANALQSVSEKLDKMLGSKTTMDLAIKQANLLTEKVIDDNKNGGKK